MWLEIKMIMEIKMEMAMKMKIKMKSKGYRRYRCIRPLVPGFQPQPVPSWPSGLRPTLPAPSSFTPFSSHHHIPWLPSHKSQDISLGFGHEPLSCRLACPGNMRGENAIAYTKEWMIHRRRLSGEDI